MRFKLGSTLLIALIALVALIGCENAQDLFMDTMLSMDDEMNDTMGTPSMDTGMDAGTADMEADLVKLVWLVNYPLGGKDDYIAWIASVAPTLKAPEEVKRIASYDNVYGENPHRFVEFEFNSFADAMTYLNRPDIAQVFRELPEHSSEVSTHVFIKRSDYSKTENPTRKIKSVYLVDYPLGGKVEYLAWIASVAPSLQAPEEVKRIASYDNYHGASPHRLAEFEFDSIEEANAYMERDAVRAVSAELPNRASRATVLTYELRSDYIGE